LFDLTITEKLPAIMLNRKTLILGLGNEILSDDGIGPRLVKSLSQKIDNPDIIFRSASCGGLELMEYIRGYEKAVLIDAIRTSTGKPGTVYSFCPSDFIETSNLSNLHDINFLTALHIGNILELDLPSELNIIAVEIIEDLEFSEKLTPVMEQKYPQILEEVFTIIKQIVP
jgi:hydrogenase maturation protease